VVSGQTQVSRIGMIPLRVFRVALSDVMAMSQTQTTLRMLLSFFTSATEDVISLHAHCDFSNVIMYPPYPGQAPLSACLSPDVPETCTNGYLDPHRWVMVAIRS
jgi:hypothetical protein